MTLHQVSKEADIDSPMLSKIERGERLPTNEQLQRLCKFFKVSESDLKIIHTAEKIIKEYGLNDTTYEAVRLVEEQLEPYFAKSDYRDQSIPVLTLSKSRYNVNHVMFLRKNF